MSKRINIILPETTIRTVDRMAKPGQRSRFIYGETRRSVALTLTSDKYYFTMNPVDQELQAPQCVSRAPEPFRDRRRQGPRYLPPGAQQHRQRQGGHQSGNGHPADQGVRKFTGDLAANAACL